MKNLLFVTLGTTSLMLIKRQPRDAQEEQQHFGDLVKAHSSFWEQNQMYTANPDNFKGSSAELTSTVSLMKLLEKDSPIAMSRVILLASATVEGRLAAKVVREVMTLKVYPAPIPKDQVFVREIPGLDREK